MRLPVFSITITWRLPILRQQLAGWLYCGSFNTTWSHAWIRLLEADREFSNRTFIGNLNTGSKTFTFTDNGAGTYQGWHLVGNPYPVPSTFLQLVFPGELLNLQHIFGTNRVPPGSIFRRRQLWCYLNPGTGARIMSLPRRCRDFILNGTPGITSLTLPNSAECTTVRLSWNHTDKHKWHDHLRKELCKQLYR